MTLAIAWVRQMPGGTEELLVATDSRLGGGKRLDCCPKIVILPRSDCFICFAGQTDYAYPMMLQFSMAIENYTRSKDRAMDLHDLRGYALKVLNGMRDTVHSYVKGEEVPKTTFILGGYSWIRKKYSLWNFHFKPKEGRFAYRTFSSKHGDVAFAGDWSRVARSRLVSLLRERNKYDPPVSLDLEPFEVLRDLLRSAKPEDTIGGPPQIAKVYQHMNCKPLGVYWPNSNEGSVTLLGRTLLHYETPNVWVLDPDTLVTSHAYYSSET